MVHERTPGPSYPKPPQRVLVLVHAGLVSNKVSQTQEARSYQKLTSRLTQVVVAISLVLMIIELTSDSEETGDEGGGFNINTIRLMRVFRIVRIFGRLRACAEFWL